MSTELGSGLNHREERTRTSAADRAYAFVKDRILTGDFAGGTLISEGEVADAVVISRTPVREAFLRLEVEGLLRLYPKRGALVVPVSSEEIHDVLDARLLIERHAAETLIGTGRNRQVAEQLRAINERQRAESADAIRFTELDRQFHSTLVEAAGNRLLVDFYAALRDRQLRMGTVALLRAPGRMESILDEHDTLAGHLDDGDFAALSAALGEHLAATRKALHTPAPGR